ncbi:hypothetical protein GJ689_14650 [Rhodoplanes serenus]|uniref:Uncharacterized protein n=1 Tax=Rhodoplanes serenus TaxID=200615 RepID=A0A9X4XLM6_9BRAD|nr:hypothetical protein [Rhodoplanes serenus]MTW17442.1 hypothetical protein [Rhodoplanes serenus]
MSRLESAIFTAAGIALVLGGLAWSGWVAGHRGHTDAAAALLAVVGAVADHTAPRCLAPSRPFGG